MALLNVTLTIYFTEACNYLFVYEYVVDIQLKTDTWGAIKRGVTTKALNVEDRNDDDDDDGKPTADKVKKNMNRTLLLGGRKDGYIAVYNWETGEVDFKIDVSEKPFFPCMLFVSILLFFIYIIFIIFKWLTVYDR